MGNPLVDSLLAEGDAETETHTEDTPIPPKAEGDIVNPSETELDEHTVDDKPPLTNTAPPASKRPAVPLDDDEDKPERPKRAAAKTTTKAAPPKSKVTKEDTPPAPPRTAKATHTSDRLALSEDFVDRIADKVADKVADRITEKLFK